MTGVWVIIPGRIVRLFRRCEGPYYYLQCHGCWRWLQHFFPETLKQTYNFVRQCNPENYHLKVESSWNVMAHGDAREGKWRGNWRMEWIASILHTTSEYGLCSITTAVAHTAAASSQLNWRPRQYKWTRPFRLKTKSGFWACPIIISNAVYK